MPLPIDYVEQESDYDALVTRTGRVAALREILSLEEEMLTLGFEIRKHDRNLREALQDANIEVPSLEAYKSVYYGRYQVERHRIEARLKDIVTVELPAAEAALSSVSVS